MSFFEKVSELNKYQKNVSAIVISGNGIGNRAIWSGRELVYFTGEKDFWCYYSEKIIECTDGKIINLNNCEVYVELVHNTPEIIICGGGHISIPIITICKLLGFYVTVIEDRPKFANNARAAKADVVICDDFENALNNIEGGADKYFVIVTRGHRHDQLCLKQIINKSNAYIGMIGSKLRVKKVKEDLIEQGIPKVLLDTVYSPIGLSINAETPEEISVSIMAEIIQVKNKKQKGMGYEKDFLKELTQEEYKHVPKTMVTIIERKGSAPRGVGAKMIVFRDGTTIGSIGGGCVEAEVLNCALKCIDEKATQVVEYDMTGKEVEDEGMVCGGVVKMVIEYIPDLYLLEE